MDLFYDRSPLKWLLLHAGRQEMQGQQEPRFNSSLFRLADMIEVSTKAVQGDDSVQIAGILLRLFSILLPGRLPVENGYRQTICRVVAHIHLLVIHRKQSWFPVGTAAQGMPIDHRDN